LRLLAPSLRQSPQPTQPHRGRRGVSATHLSPLALPL
jgi:hypothetical protein